MGIGLPHERTLDDVQQGLYADSCVQNLDHLLNCEPGFFTCCSKFLDGSCQNWVFHNHLTLSERLGRPCEIVCDPDHIWCTVLGGKQAAHGTLVGRYNPQPTQPAAALLGQLNDFPESGGDVA